ncbi:hypothetical protein PIB30_053950 [Stylosanthes scabra]|uniref:Uncharacterized protein n=1 Tax=Stylosanthes scabra TaxID=79078 RepID=A0ABU6UM38_9FABA|nr:hypothetical protein [Stylosanthes scabra]
MSKALKNCEDEKKEEEEVVGGIASPLWDCGSPLYDSFELVTLSHIIDRHTVVLPHLSGSKKAISHGSESSHHHHEVMKKISNEEDGKGSSSLKKSKSFSEILDMIMGKRKVIREGGKKKKGNNNKLKKTKNGFSGLYNKFVSRRKSRVE